MNKADRDAIAGILINQRGQALGIPVFGADALIDALADYMVVDAGCDCYQTPHVMCINQRFDREAWIAQATEGGA